MIFEIAEFKVIFRQSLMLTHASLKSRYRSTWAGLLWVILLPILTFFAQSFAFHFILKIQMKNYLLYLVSGLIPWIFLAARIEMCAGVYVNSGALLKSMPIHPLSILFAQVADNFINYIVAFILLTIPVGIYSNFELIRMFYFFPAFISLLIFVIGFSHLIATLNVFYRDIKFVIGFVLNICFFMTPIFYPKQLIPESLSFFVSINPIGIMLAPFQSVATGAALSDLLSDLLFSFLISTTVLIVSILYWRKARNAIYFRF